MKILLACTISIVSPFAISGAHGQTPCTGTSLSGSIVDSTLALIPSANISLDGTRTVSSDSDGRFGFSCVSAGTHHLLAARSGFSQGELSVTVPQTAPLQFVLQLEPVETSMDVEAADTNEAPNSSGPTLTISGTRLHALADDPDDLLRELQQLAAAAGGNPANVTVAVDGFQGSSALPPKGSIAYIRVNPDQFSAEYRQPPFEGGRVEVYTKPGQKAFHGALFATNGSAWMNARDPFSTSKAPLGKQRYGFELTGPIRKVGSDFAMTLEHRSIDNFAVVNAVTLDGNGKPLNVTANVANPQRLWLGTARSDIQLGPKNTFISSYNARVNHVQNVGVGGVVLAEAGYDYQQYEHTLRFTDVTTVSTRLMHEARFSLRWDGSRNTPNSVAPQLQVAGAMTSGGSSLGTQSLQELNLEADDDAVLTTSLHSFKFGTQWMLYDENQQLPTNFNGSYTFGGGLAPVLDSAGQPISGQTETISGLEQYRRALLHREGGLPTAFSNVSGEPTVAFVQIQDALFLQDDWNIGHRLHVAYGLRYYLQNNPTVLNSITPRLGLQWSPDTQGAWTVHAHIGMFSGRYDQSEAAEVRREDGVNRVTSTVYNPVYGTPFIGSTPIHSLRQFSPHIATLTWAAENVGGTYAMHHGWNLSADVYLGRIWNYVRSVNINSPVNGEPNGPRPGAPNLNVLQVQNSGQGRVSAEFVGLEQHAMKRFQISLGGVHLDLVDDTDDSTFFTPQSSYSNVGEFAHRTNQPAWQIFGNGSLKLPANVELSGQFHAGGDAHYNITTGFDNNGDGDFNDRPQFAASGAAGIATPFGLLVSSGGTGVFPRNKGVMPWTYYLDANLQRAFTLPHKPAAEHQQILTLNLRSANLLNHTDVTQVGGVLGSPLFGLGYAADNGRRVEAGLRYSF